MPSFQNPLAFLLLLFIPFLYLLRRLKIFTRISFPAVLSDWNGKVFEWNDKAHKMLSVFSKVLVFVAFFMVILSFADPVISRQEKVYTSMGTDLVFVLDASPSMAARDMNGYSRLDEAKRTIKQLITDNDGVRLGIIVLGSNASVFVPPTTDHQTVIQRLDDVKVGILGTGSAIGDGLSTAVCHLLGSSAPNKCIILLTDGENNAGSIHPETATNLAKDNKIPVYVIGIGSKGTVVLEYEDPITKKMYSGHYDSNFNPSSLRKIANISNGKYFEAHNTDELLSTVYSITKTENVTQTFTYKTVNREIYDVFLFWGIVIFAFAWIIRLLLLNEKF